MTLVSNERNDVVCSPSLTEETIGTLTYLPTLPFDLIPEILSKLSVKQLLQLRCVCKSWKSLISDPKFAKKHLALSTTYSLHGINYYAYPNYILESYSLDSSMLIAQTDLPSNGEIYFLGSCNGILCLAEKVDGLFLVRLWNPSIRKFKELPPIIEPHNYNFGNHKLMSGFGYDPISDNYKVVFVLLQLAGISGNEVKVHTLGTDSWKSVSVFPFAGFNVKSSGQYVSGTINWLGYMDIKQDMENKRGRSFIASFDLGNESYQKVLLPDYLQGVTFDPLIVFRECLCMICYQDVWVMKEYGNKESWTKLFTINTWDSLTPFNLSPSCYPISLDAMYIFEDDKVLLEYNDDYYSRKYISYNVKSGTSKFIEFKDTLEVCVESLISPYF